MKIIKRYLWYGINILHLLILHLSKSYIFIYLYRYRWILLNFIFPLLDRLYCIFILLIFRVSIQEVTFPRNFEFFFFFFKSSIHNTLLCTYIVTYMYITCREIELCLWRGVPRSVHEYWSDAVNTRNWLRNVHWLRLINSIRVDSSLEREFSCLP